MIDTLFEARSEGRGVRMVGAAHSFSPVCATDGVLMSLDGLQGVLDADPQTASATVYAGSRISDLGAPLAAAGLALANQGDIDVQSLAGAISTGTHGTGPTLGNLSSRVAGLRLVLGNGTVLDCSPEREPEIFHAARIGVGALGVITRIVLRVIPSYRLHERHWIEPTETCMARLDERISNNRHFEFFWLPLHDLCALKTLNPTSAMPYGNEAFASALDLDEDTLNAPQDPTIASFFEAPERVDWSWRIFPSVRTARMREMEFAVEAVNGPACFDEICRMIRSKYPALGWPVEYRTLAQDDIPLSQAYGRDSVTISVHQDIALPWEDLFADAEAVFRNHRGRPHWGKLHSHRANELSALYPEWNKFMDIRERLDPDRMFMNEHLRQIFG
ncbi:FAD-linked oxidoreductase [Sphingobium boeckii]|uniref:FAD-linked oxidoreductase n=1 Tax=Sphingobium boeckii TaxID=1082345 RepID=A0A7W9EE68_9SPHN|nr:FAD-linked oxidoreductase [Sphingobium boeckii]